MKAEKITMTREQVRNVYSMVDELTCALNDIHTECVFGQPAEGRGDYWLEEVEVNLSRQDFQKVIDELQTLLDVTSK